MMYLILYTQNVNGIYPVEINLLKERWDNVKNTINSFSVIIRATIEFKIGGKTFFEYCIKNNGKNIKDRICEDLHPFVSYGGGTTGYNLPKQSFGIIDRGAGIRLEYMNDRIKLYQI